MTNQSDPPLGVAGPTTPKYRMWAVHCPFKKSGFPVLGTFGYTSRDVVILSMETWTQLCKDIPALQTTEFEVGTYD